MGHVIPHKKVKLVIGFIFKDEPVLRRTKARISKMFGSIDFNSPVMDFIHTDYYNKESGEGLRRQFISLDRLIDPERIHRVKLITNRIERSFLTSGKRAINIDPGYITEAKLVLLTTKDHIHRVYLRSGIYAESTLRFRHGTYVAHETTYPDYRSDAYIDIFNRIRDIYRKQVI